MKKVLVLFPNDWDKTESNYLFKLAQALAYLLTEKSSVLFDDIQYMSENDHLQMKAMLSQPLANN